MTGSYSVLGALAACAALALCGCVQEDEKTKVERDGSGTFTLVMTVDTAAMEQLKQMFGGMGRFGRGQPGGTGGVDQPPDMGGEPAMEGEPGMDGEAGMEDKPASEDENLTKMKERLAKLEGIELKSAKSERVEGKARVTAEVAFKTLPAYAKATAMPFSTDLVKNEDGSYTLKFEFKGSGMGGGGGAGGEAGGEAGMGGAGESGAGESGAGASGAGASGAGASGAGASGAGGMTGGMMAMLEPMLGSMSFKRTLTLPGAVKETNGAKAEDGSISWTTTFKDMTAGKPIVQSVTFSGEGIDWRPFHQEPDKSGWSGAGRGGAPGMPGGGFGR